MFKEWKHHVFLHWMQFCDYTTLAGFHLIPKQNIKTKSRAVLFVTWLVLICLVFKLCGDKLEQYHEYNVDTSMRFDTVHEHQFPAITFCNTNSFKRSVIGLDDYFMVVASGICSKSSKEIYETARQSFKTCKFEYNESADTLKQRDEFYHYYYKSDYENMFKMFSVNSTMSTLKCWWNNWETDCNKHFMNHAIDDVACFTFNQDSNFLDTVNGLLPVYAPKEFAPENLYVNTTGHSNGLKLLLNLNQQEYCLVRDPRTGAGFSVFVHDMKSETSLQIQSSILLSPGFEYDIVLQPVQYDLRNFSQWLGKCTTYEYNFLKPDSSTYNQQACYQACVMEGIFRSCKCLPVQPGSITDSVAKYLGSSKVCDLLEVDLICTVTTRQHLLTLHPEVACPRCKRKCLETKYEYKITNKKLSRSNVQKLLPQTLKNNQRVENNVILVSFHFETMNLLTIRETQAISPLNLFVYWSNILCLFLGFTIITMPELLYYIFTTIRISFQICLRNENRNSEKEGTNRNRATELKTFSKRTSDEIDLGPSQCGSRSIKDNHRTKDRLLDKPSGSGYGIPGHVITV